MAAAYEDQICMAIALLERGANPTQPITRASPLSTTRAAEGFLGLVTTFTIAYSLDCDDAYNDTVPISRLRNLLQQFQAAGVTEDQLFDFECFYVTNARRRSWGTFRMRAPLRFVLQVTHLRDCDDQDIDIRNVSVDFCQSVVQRSARQHYEITAEGSKYLLQALVPFWQLHTPNSEFERESPLSKARAVVWQRLSELRESALKQSASAPTMDQPRLSEKARPTAVQGPFEYKKIALKSYLMPHRWPTSVDEPQLQSYSTFDPLEIGDRSLIAKAAL